MNQLWKQAAIQPHVVYIIKPRQWLAVPQLRTGTTLSKAIVRPVAQMYMEIG